MKQETVNNIVALLKEIKDSNLTIQDYFTDRHLHSNTLSAKITNLKNSYINGKVSEKTYRSIIKQYKELKKINKVRSHNERIEIKKSEEINLFNNDVEDTDNRSEVEIIRDENNKIQQYKFIVYIRDNEPLTGTFTRDEMNLIYRMYSSYGSNITQREVSRMFPEYSLCDFKRILRTFNITKASSPFPPHMIEEKSKEELMEMQLREKENDFLRSYEAEKVRQLDLQLKKYLKENADLKDQLHSFDNLLDTIDLSSLEQYKFKPSKNSSKRDLMIWLSDMHIGAFTSDYSLYDNTYDSKEVGNRLEKVFKTIVKEGERCGGFDNIILCNLGDSLDGYNSKTARGTELPQNMNNKEQVKAFIENMSTFVINITKSIPCNNFRYYAVGESNHGSDFEYAANTALAYICISMGIEATVFDKAIDFFKVKDVTYVITHGNDNKNMNRGLPLTINDRTENYINDFLNYNNITGKVVFVKGDLHQSATTIAKRFTYKSVGSLYGSSDWIQANFGFTKASCDYSIVDEEGNRLDGLVILN